MLTFATKYKLKKDIPTHKAGSGLRWDGIRQGFYFTLPGKPYDLDYDGPSFTVEQIQKEDWFAPTNEVRPFIPTFPSEDKINEFASLGGECRLVDSVDECRAINALLEDSGFSHRLYEFYRDQYNRFHRLERTKSEPRNQD